MITTLGYAAHSTTSPLAPLTFTRRDPGPRDIQIEIQYCGVCHSDLHQARNDWKGTNYPIVPGHEIVGKVAAIGRDVRKFKEGDAAAVGCMVDSCRTCVNCKEGYEQYCDNIATYTYNSEDKVSGGFTYGGYSQRIVVDQDFALRVPGNLNVAAVAPLLCAGITTYSPLRHWKVAKGQKVGIIGLGGLGHMGLKFASVMGAHVVLFTRSKQKIADAKRLGAHEVVLSDDEQAMKQHKSSFDFLLDTVSAQHAIESYLSLLKRDGTLSLVGLPGEPLPIPAFSLCGKRRRFAGSSIGGIAETQEMLDFCSQHNIVSDIEMISMPQINEAFERLIKSDVKYRFVIDMASLKE